MPSGQIIRAADFLPGVGKLTGTPGQDISNASVTDIVFDFVDVEEGVTADPTTGGITVGRSGVYSCKAYFRMNAGGGTRVQVGLRVNGSPVVADDRHAASGTCGYSTAVDLPLEAGDVVTATVYQNSGSSRSMVGGNGGPSLSVFRIT